MKLNNRGFAISGTIYALMFLFIILIFATLGLLGSRKVVLDKYKQGIVKDVQLDNILSSSGKVDKSGAIKPMLTTSMIPVIYNGTNWVKAEYISEYDQDWYDYGDKRWANAVVVKSSAINNYNNASAGTVINSSDILAYYVWIPKFKYKLFNVSYENKTHQLIDVVFEGSDSIPSNGLENGEYITHPAFETYNGFWISKFESTGTLEAITSLPNSTPITNYSLKEMNDAVEANKSNYSVNYNIIKNSEWAAVAYLTNSNYGLGDTEIRKNAYNQSSGFKTGCGSNTTSNSPRTASCEMGFGSSTTYPQSTTGNIYGVFDMSGGVWEYTLSVMKNIASTPVYSSSGFTSTNMPLPANYDTFGYGTNPADYTRTELGSATGEVFGWYSDKSELVSGTSSWLIRGGRNTDTDDVGIFSFSADTGEAREYIGFRTTIKKATYE